MKGLANVNDIVAVPQYMCSFLAGFCIVENDLEDTLFKFVQYGVNVFGIDPALDPHEIAEKAIACTEDFLFNKLGIPRTLSEIGVDDKHLDEIAESAARGLARGFVPLTKEDVLEILKKAL